MFHEVLKELQRGQHLNRFAHCEHVQEDLFLSIQLLRPQRTGEWIPFVGLWVDWLALSLASHVERSLRGFLLIAVDGNNVCDDDDH